jgi:serine O-acetyltransferase
MAQTVRELFAADYRALYRDRDESPRRRRIAFLPRLLTNPSLHAVLLLRLANASPRFTWWFWRQVLVSKHAMDWTGPFEIGPGLRLPHPVGVVMGPGVRLGSEVMIAHNVSIGSDAYGRGPQIGDRVAIYPGAIIIGNVRIGEGSVVGAANFLTSDVPPNSMVKRGVVEPMRESSFSREVERTL